MATTTKQHPTSVLYVKKFPCHIRRLARVGAYRRNLSMADYISRAILACSDEADRTCAGLEVQQAPEPETVHS